MSLLRCTFRELGLLDSDHVTRILLCCMVPDVEWARLSKSENLISLDLFIGFVT